MNENKHFISYVCSMRAPINSIDESSYQAFILMSAFKQLVTKLFATFFFNKHRVPSSFVNFSKWRLTYLLWNFQFALEQRAIYLYCIEISILDYTWSGLFSISLSLIFLLLSFFLHFIKKKKRWDPSNKNWHSEFLELILLFFRLLFSYFSLSICCTIRHLCFLIKFVDTQTIRELLLENIKLFTHHCHCHRINTMPFHVPVSIMYSMTKGL